MPTPGYSSGEPNHFFNFKENNFADTPLHETEDNQFDGWDDQLKSSALELQIPMPRQSSVNTSSGASTSMPRTDSLWDERTPLVGMPTNGKAALAAIIECWNRIPPRNSICTAQMRSLLLYRLE